MAFMERSLLQAWQVRVSSLICWCTSYKFSITVYLFPQHTSCSCLCALHHLFLLPRDPSYFANMTSSILESISHSLLTPAIVKFSLLWRPQDRAYLSYTYYIVL